MSDSSDGNIRQQVNSNPTGSQRELRELSQGNLDVDHDDDLHPHAGLIQDDEIRDVLSFMAENYEPPKDDQGRIIEGFPPDFWSTDFAKRAIRKYATETAAEAIAEDNVSQISYINGLPSYESDVSGIHAINQLSDWLVHSEQCKLAYLAAHMGSGKTSLSCLMMEVIDDHYQRVSKSTDEEEIVEPQFACNFPVTSNSDTTIKQINDYDKLLEWADDGEGSDSRKWFVFDEASTELTAQSGSNAQTVAEIMAPFIKKMRKMGVNMIVIGHDKGDVHVAIRSLADYVDKKDLKSASFYAGITDREPTGHLFDLSGIPDTSWHFDTDDTADWSWGSAIEDDEDEFTGYSDEELKSEIAERGARIYKQTDLTLEDVADSISNDEISVSASTISRRADQVIVDANNSSNGVAP